MFSNIVHSKAAHGMLHVVKHSRPTRQHTVRDENRQKINKTKKAAPIPGSLRAYFAAAFLPNISAKHTQRTYLALETFHRFFYFYFFFTKKNPVHFASFFFFFFFFFFFAFYSAANSASWQFLPIEHYKQRLSQRAFPDDSNLVRSVCRRLKF